MERVTEQQIRAAHDASTSFEYKRLLGLRDEQITEDKVRAASGCLLRVQGIGFDSGTPTECPVVDCSAKFDKASLSVLNQGSCIDPVNVSLRKK